MNRYHLGILFSAIALILFSGIFIRHEYVSRRQTADRQTEETLQFAISCAIGSLNSEYGGNSDYHSVSDNFFKALALMREGQSVLEGRIAPEDFYPYVPVLLCMEERYYHIGIYDGASYRWSEAKYYPDNHTKAETDEGLLLDMLERDIGSALTQYHSSRDILDTQYLLPDYIVRNLASSNTATMLSVLENFPTALYGYSYSGTYGAGGMLREMQ